MDQLHSETVDGGAATDSRAKWIRPNVDRLIAGGAEAGGSTTTDGIDIFS